MMTRFARLSQRGFSLIELMVVVAVISIIAAIALPNFQRAMRDTRRKSAYTAAIKVSNAIELHAAKNELPPNYADFSLRTMQPLVDSQSLTTGEVTSLLNRFEGDQLDAYYTWSGAGWNFGSERAFIVYFRPEGEPTASCYIWNKWGRCWYPETSTLDLFTGDYN